MTLVYILLGTILLVLLFFLYRQNQQNSIDHGQEITNKLNELFPMVLKNANDQLISMANQKLVAEKQEIKTDLSNKKTAIEDMIKRVVEEINKNQKKLENAEAQRIGNFEALRESLENYKKITQDLSATTEGLRKVLSNNQLRGAFGEKVAEDLLKMSGFVRGVDYEFNKEQQGTDSRPDFAVFLPDGAKINVDAKFPYSNLQKMAETEGKEAKAELAKLFERDIKEKVRQITSRDYIDAENKTVDFVILFIPNEMIFSYIYDKLPDVWQEAMSKKVIFAGPFSFTAILRMVRQAYDNFRYQKNVQAIITQIKTFEKEFTKYNDEFSKIGDKISVLSRQYDEVNGVRTSKLLRVIDKIKIEEGSVKSIEHETEN